MPRETDIMDDCRDVIPPVGVYHKGSAFCQRMSQLWIPGNQGWYQAQPLPLLSPVLAAQGPARMDTLRHTNTFIPAHTGEGLLFLPLLDFSVI